MESNTTKQHQRATPKTLQWRLINNHDEIWIGEIIGSLNSRFELHELGNDKYLIQSNLDGIRKLVVRSLDHAKTMAQENFNTYALGLLEGSKIKNT